jgi:hypothetical protein
MTAPLTEETLRAVRDDLLERVTDQQEAFGILPRVHQAEQVIGPIVEKISRDHDRQERRAPARPAPAQAVREDADGTTHITSKGLVGRFNFTTGEMEVTPEAAAHLAERNSLERRVIRMIRDNPRLLKWRTKLLGLMTKPLPPGHAPQNCGGCGSDAVGRLDVCRIRETAIEVLLIAFAKQYGLT